MRIHQYSGRFHYITCADGSKIGIPIDMDAFWFGDARRRGYHVRTKKQRRAAKARRAA